MDSSSKNSLAVFVVPCLDSDRYFISFHTLYRSYTYFWYTLVMFFFRCTNIPTYCIEGHFYQNSESSTEDGDFTQSIIVMESINNSNGINQQLYFSNIESLRSFICNGV